MIVDLSEAGIDGIYITPDTGEPFEVRLYFDLEPVGSVTVASAQAARAAKNFQFVAYMDYDDTRALLGWLIDCISAPEDATL